MIVEKVLKFLIKIEVADYLNSRVQIRVLKTAFTDFTIIVLDIYLFEFFIH